MNQLMNQGNATTVRRARRNLRRLGAVTLLALSYLSLGSSLALAGPPAHPRLASEDIGGLNRACGAAVDSYGDVYVASAGESKVKVFNPAHDELASLANANEPCGLAVDTNGSLYVSEKATGKVVRYTPNAYPLTGSPGYGPAEAIDSTGNAKGIATGPFDDSFYVAEGSHVSLYNADGTPGKDEEQFLNTLNVGGGEYRLIFEGEETTPISAAAGNAQIQSALAALPSIGAGNISVAEGEFGTNDHRITFGGTLGGTDVERLQADTSALTGSLEITTKIEGFDGHIGEGELGEATAVAAYSYGAPENVHAVNPTHYLFVEDASSDSVKVFRGLALDDLKLADVIDGSTVPDSETCPDCSEGFGQLSAALAVDWATGHLFVYDGAHGVLDEFDANGHYLDQTHSAEFADAEPSGLAVLPQLSQLWELRIAADGGTYTLGLEGQQTGPLPFDASAAQIQGGLEGLASVGAGNVVVENVGGPPFRIRLSGARADRHTEKLTIDDTALTRTGSIPFTTLDTLSRGYGPGRLYVGAGAGPGAKLLAFGPLAAPSRAPLTGFSHTLEKARAVAIDDHGYVYVADSTLVHVFSPGGSEVKVGSQGKGIGISAVQDLAVDSTGKVYAAENQERVGYFTPSAYPPVDGTTYARHEPPIVSSGSPTSIALNPSDDHLLVASFLGAIVEFDSAAAGSAFIRNFGSTLGFGHPKIDVYGANGDVYVSENNGGVDAAFISVVNAAGTERLARITGLGSPRGPFGLDPEIAVDQANGHVLAFSNRLGAIREYDGAGGFVGEFAFPEPQGFTEEAVRPSAIAIDNSGGPNSGDAYVALDDPKPDTPDLWAFGPLSYGAPPAASTGVAGGLAGGNATLHGTVNPNGFDLSQCDFEYLEDTTYQANLAAEDPAFAGASTVTCAENFAEVGKGGEGVAVHADVGGLVPEGRYRFRLLAANQFGSSEGDAALFGPPIVTAKSPQPILYEEATLRGEVEPSGLGTRYHFEYGTSAAYGNATPAVELAPGEGTVFVQVALTELQADAVYHFRLVAENAAGTVNGPDRTFLTLARPTLQNCPNAEYRSGLSAELPDCRAYELITPADTRGSLPLGAMSSGFSSWLTPPSGAGAGESLSYFISGTTLPGFEGNGRIDGYTATRGAGAHPPQGWSSRLFAPTYTQAGDGEVLIAGSPGAVPGSPGGISSDQGYSFWKVGPPKAFEGDLSAGSYLRTPSGFEALGKGSLGEDPEADSRFLSPGGAHAIFSSDAHLEPGAPPASTLAIYDRAAGAAEAEVISVPPPPPSEPSPAEEAEYEDLREEFETTDAIYRGSSEDGTAIAFSLGGSLYLHRAGTTTEIAEAPTTFAGVSADGKRVFYLGSGSQPGVLVACDLAQAPCTGADQIAADGIFLNVSADGSHVFFDSKDAIAGTGANANGEEAQAGEHNLYVWGGGSTDFVARLDPRDFESFAGDQGEKLDLWLAAIAGSPGQSPLRSTPDGEVLLFQSHAKLTDYDNEEVGEIYRYDPAATPDEQLLCVSCDPTGAAPSTDALLQDLSNSSPVSAEALIPNQTADGAAVFFQSPDRLLPEDSNTVQDVYEWKAHGSGKPACERPGGCLALISSGQGDSPSFLYSMTSDAHDVFISTPEKLVPSDLPGSPSTYDVRIDGGIPEQSSGAPCRGDACQGQGSSPPALPAPSTVGLGMGEDGNVGTREGASRCAKGKRKVSRQGKTRCVARHRKSRKHQAKPRHRDKHDGRAER
jgi:hypothetical protein